MKTSDPAAGDALPFFLGVNLGWGRSLVYRVYLALPFLGVSEEGAEAGDEGLHVLDRVEDNV